MNSIDKFKVINSIANESSRKTKEAILYVHPELRVLLKCAYDPFIKFYVKPTESWITGIGVEVFSDSTNKLLNNLVTRKLTGNAAKSAVMAELARLEPMSQELLLRVLNKDLRMGVSNKTINKVFPGLLNVFPVQLASLYDGRMMSYPCLGSFKIDGLRCIYQNGSLYSRKGHELVGLDHIVQLIKAYKVERVDGEIIVPGKRFDDLSGEIRAFKKTDNAKYMVFDVHMKEELPLYKRQTLASQLVKAINNEAIGYVEHRTLRNADEVSDMYYEAIDLGYEGLVVKKEDGLAYDGRNRDWQKIKPTNTIDLEVVSIKEGTGKYEGMVGALICDHNGIEVSVGSGLSDLQRETWYNDNNAIVGKVIEIAYMEDSKNGRLRHPRLVTVRGDK